MTPSIMPYVKDSEGRDVVPIFLDGKPISISSNSRLEPVTSFSSGKTPHYFMSATVDSCHEACESAWTAFSGTVLDTAGGSGWKRASAVTRRDIILKAADLFEARRQELIDAQILETSCSAVWAQNNIATSVGYMREIASCVSQIHGTIPTINKPDTFAFVFKEPVGPVLIIPPWNAALVLATRALTSAIGAGCSVVLKASELCPLTHSLIVAIYHDAGLPAGVLNSLQCRREDAGEITETLIKNERIRKVEFIGSAAVGRIIGSVAAKYLKPVLMELGGKGPALILEDADLPKAATLCAKGATLHHGQICFSTERIILPRNVFPQLKPLLIEAFEAETARISAPVHAGIASKAQSLLSEARDAGVEFLTGGPSTSSAPTLAPTLLLIDLADPAQRALGIVDDESFAPCACVYLVDSDAQALELANASAYGLNATIHTRDMQRALKLGRELEYGQVHVNSISVFTSWTGPQGGVKGSGWGRQNAGWGLAEFLVDRFVTFHGEGSG